MLKKDLVSAFAEQVGITKKDATVLVDGLFEVLANTLASGEEININGFGKLKIKLVAERTGINPQTQEVIQIPAKKRVSFVVSKNLKELINK